jgi:hypothetical protein
MNPTEDDNEEEVVENIAVEPKKEHVVRHTEPHDSYRESARPLSPQEIVQPPLDPPEDVYSSGADENNSIAQVVDISSPVEEIPTVSPVPVSSPVVTLNTGTSDDSATPVEVSEIFKDAPNSSATLPAQTLLTDEPVVYHTLSGGPETIKDKRTKDGFINPNITAITGHSNLGGEMVPGTSGYSVPQPGFVTSQPVQKQGSAGLIFLFLLILLLGGPAAYLYYFMPDTFNQAVAALMVIKNQLLKQ